MLNVLTDIYHGIVSIPFWIVGGIVECINLVIAGLAAFVVLVLSMLPEMPDRPEIPDDGVVAMMNWLLPVEQWLAVAGVCLVALIAYFLVRWALQSARFS